MGKFCKKSASKVETDPTDDLKSSDHSEENEKSEATLEKRIKRTDYMKTRVNLKKQKKHVLKVGRVPTFSDLPLDLVGDKIFTKVPITSLGAVRSTCKSWEALSRDWILSKAAAAKRQFLGFMTMDYKVYSLRIHLLEDKDYEVAKSIKPVDILNQFEISKLIHCDGLLLCVLDYTSKLVVCNPYLGQTRWIEPRTNFNTYDRYALGYDNNQRNHKILRFLNHYDFQSRKRCFVCEIYDFRSHSWRVLDFTPDWAIESDALDASLNGNTYFSVKEYILPGTGHGEIIERFLVCFDFTNERFGPRLPLPFHLSSQETVTLSCAREEQLAVLHQRLYTLEILEFWVTTKINPNAVSWSKFLTVELETLYSDHMCDVYSFFIDEEEKVAVVLDAHFYSLGTTGPYHSAFIIGDDGYFECLGKYPTESGPPLVCSSSYRPSLVQIN